MEKIHDADDMYIKQNFFQISGIDESKDESTAYILMGIYYDLKTEVTLAEIDRCHRKGKPKMYDTWDVKDSIATHRAQQK